MTVDPASAFDCDVHCAPPATAALEEYLTGYWREYVEVSGAGFTAPRRVYPPWVDALASQGAETVEQLGRDALDGRIGAIVNCYTALECIGHPDLAAELMTATNRWLEAEWLNRDDRLSASAVVTTEFPDAAVAEIERLSADSRFLQLLLPARSNGGYGQRRYWPIWEAASRHGLVLGITFGGIPGAAPTTSGWLANYFEDNAAQTVAFQSQIVSLVMQGTFARFPDLRVTIMESGWTWAPALMWRMDQWWKGLRREVPWVQEPPSVYVRRHFRFTTQPTDAMPSSSQLRHARQHLGGSEMLLFASDYPHKYATTIDELLHDLDAADAEAIRSGNAREWYGSRLGCDLKTGSG